MPCAKKAYESGCITRWWIGAMRTTGLFSAIVSTRCGMMCSKPSLTPARDWSRYVRYLHGQVEELLTRYGQIDVLYFDFSYWNFTADRWGAADLMKRVRELQPDIIVNDRLGNEAIKQTPMPVFAGDFDHAEQNIPRDPVTNNAGLRVPWEAWFTTSNSWCHSQTDINFKSPATIIRALVNCVSKGGNLSLNVGPDATGRLHHRDIALLDAIGQWMEPNAPSIRGCGPAALPKPEWGRYTLSADGRHLLAHILDATIGHISLQGLRGKIKNPFVLATGKAGWLGDYWNPGIQTFDAPDDVFFNFALPAQATWPLPNAIDTVVRFDIVESPKESGRIIKALDQQYLQATARLPLP